MEALERQAAKIMAATKQAELDAATGAASAENPEEIDLDEEFDLDDEEDSGGGGGGGGGGGVANVTQKAVPAAVFGETLAKERDEAMAKEAEERANGGGEEEEESTMGALERMKVRKGLRGGVTETPRLSHPSSNHTAPHPPQREAEKEAKAKVSLGRWRQAVANP